MSSSNKRILKNTIFLYLRLLIVMAVALYTSRVILDVLGASDFGLYNVVGGVVTTLAFLNGALSASTSRFLTYELGTGNKERFQKIFSASLNLHIGVALLVFILGETVGIWFLNEKLVIPSDRLFAASVVFQFSILTTMVTFTQIPYTAALIAHENMSIYAYVGLYEAISKLLIVYGLQISPIDKLISYAFLLMLNTIAVQLFLRFYVIRKYNGCRFKVLKDKSLYKELMGYSSWDLCGNLAAVCQGQGINILLNLFFGPVVNAARAITFQIQGTLAMLIRNFLTAVRPQVVKNFASGNTEEMYRLSFYAAKFSYLLVFTLMYPLCLELDYVLRLWLGNNVPEDTYIFTIIVLITYLMETFHSAALMPYHAIGRIKTGNIVGGSLMIAALPISYFCLEKNGPPYVVFIVIFLLNFTQMFFTWWIIHRYVYFRWMDLVRTVFLPCMKITILASVMPFILKGYMEQGFLKFFIISMTTFIIVLILTYYMALNQRERETIKKLLKEKLLRV